jgi:hypothetical protein
VSAILTAQRDAEINPPAKIAVLRARSFGQQYERYSPNGGLDPAKGLPPR